MSYQSNLGRLDFSEAAWRDKGSSRQQNAQDFLPEHLVQYRQLGQPGSVKLALYCPFDPLFQGCPSIKSRLAKLQYSLYIRKPIIYPASPPKGRNLSRLSKCVHSWHAADWNSVHRQHKPLHHFGRPRTRPASIPTGTYPGYS
jgi:hypothetical protein